MGSTPSQYEVPEERRSSGLVLREAVDENEANEQRLKMYRERQMKEILKAGTAGKPGLVLRQGNEEDESEEDEEEDEEEEAEEVETEIGKKSLNKRDNVKYERLKEKQRKPHYIKEEDYEQLADEEDEEAVVGEVETQIGKDKEERQRQKERRAQEKAEDELMDKIREQYWKNEVPDDKKGKAQEKKEIKTDKELRKEQERLKVLRVKQRQEDIAARRAMHKRTKTFPQGACQTTIDNRL